MLHDTEYVEMKKKERMSEQTNDDALGPQVVQSHLVHTLGNQALCLGQHVLLL